MITEDYVSFETAMLLNEKGFSEKTASFYKGDGTFCSRIGNIYQPFDWNHDKFVFYSTPTLQMAMKWLREVHNIIIVVEPYMYNCVDSKTSSYIYSIWCGDNYDCKNEEYNSYEEAAEAAIKYCLENLI